MLTHYGVSLTTSFTLQQRARVDAILEPIVLDALSQIAAAEQEILDMDKRPHKTYSEKDPNVFFRYVRQAMLEDLIAYLQSCV